MSRKERSIYSRAFRLCIVKPGNARMHWLKNTYETICTAMQGVFDELGLAA
jgi:hypothetical protein